MNGVDWAAAAEGLLRADAPPEPGVVVVPASGWRVLPLAPPPPRRESWRFDQARLGVDGREAGLLVSEGRVESFQYEVGRATFARVVGPTPLVTALTTPTPGRPRDLTVTAVGQTPGAVRLVLRNCYLAGADVRVQADGMAVAEGVRFAFVSCILQHGVRV